MYTTKFTHKNQHIENGRYITIGDPYKTSKDTLPPRWKEKQFGVPQLPMNAGEGYFGHAGKAFSYEPDKYTEQVPYTKLQPHDKRKLGFGTHDASKRDEFTQSIRTEQYRQLLKQEKGSMSKQHDVGVAEKVLAKAKAAKADVKYVEGKKEITHLYDVGRNIHTEFDPKHHRETYYTMKHGFYHDKRMGSFRTASQDIGEGMWAVKYQQPEFSAASQTKNFYDKSHLGVTGF